MTALGGGFPRGRIVELFGPSGCGKTTLALQCVAARSEATAHRRLDRRRPYLRPRLRRAPGRRHRSVCPSLNPPPPNRAWKSRAPWRAPARWTWSWWIPRRPWCPTWNWRPASATTLQGCIAACWHRDCGSCVTRWRNPGPCVAVSQPDAQPAGSASAGEGETSAGGPPLKLFAAVRIALTPVRGSPAVTLANRGKIRSPRWRLRKRVLERRRGAGFVGKPVKWGFQRTSMQKNCGKSGLFRGFALYIPMPFPYD